jgi:hypothetical protein
MFTVVVATAELEAASAVEIPEVAHRAAALPRAAIAVIARRPAEAMNNSLWSLQSQETEISSGG